jgi:glycyl-tRNA synthetase beta chain
MSSFILEIFSEEIPSRMQEHGRQSLESFFQKNLQEKAISFSKIESYVTPRRLVLHIEGMPENQADQEEEKKGPKIDAPEKAIHGFLSSNNLTREQCEERELENKGTFLFAKICIKGQKTSTILSDLTTQFLKSMSWPKSMRWGICDFTWVRPIHHILLLFDGMPIDFSPPHSGITSGAYAYGHRFMAPDVFQVNTWTTYQKGLLNHNVILEQEERQKKILMGYQKNAEELGAQLPDDIEYQVKEVAGLVEWPVVCLGEFSSEFLEIPPEVLTTSMWEHQYFTPLYEKSTGALRPQFLFTSNIQSSQGMQQIIKGNEAVLRARLQDAKFFWDNDQKKSVDIWNNRLKTQIFHEKIGTVHERIDRFKVLAKAIDPENKELEIAVTYAKSDLASEMVGEFPELQGVMGSYYLSRKGFSPQVCEAIRFQYQDQGFPSQTAAFLAFIQKLETLGAFFAVGIHPTSSKDPYALRRAALGLIRTVLEQNMAVEFSALFESVYQLVKSEEKQDLASYQASLKKFLLERFRYYLRNEFSPKIVEALLKAPWIYSDFSKAYNFCCALNEVLETDQGRKVVMAFDRVHSLLEASKNKEFQRVDLEISPDLFQKSSEHAVWKHVKILQKTHKNTLKNGDLRAIFDSFEPFFELLNTLFEEVLIHDLEPKVQANRLRMLKAIDDLFLSVLNFSALTGIIAEQS